MKQYLLLISLTLILFIGTSPLHAQEVVPENFESWIEDGMEKWGIPGMAIAIVKDGEVAYAKGFGVKKLGEEGLVDEHTQFGIASVSKHITAMSVGLMVEQGLVDWIDPVRDVLPWFELSDPYATANVTIHDLLTHQVGVGRILGNRLQFMTDRSRYELLHRMRHHTFEEPFRSQYVYSNVMYTLAGEIAVAVSGRDWDNLVASRFFERMEMSRTNSTINDLDESNAAWPHQYIDGVVVPIPRRNWDIAAPAGGINSTAADMGKWMVMQLNEGSFDGKQILSEGVLREIQTPKVSLNSADVNAPQVSYGYGYRITDFRGFRVLSHGGATDGMNTNYMLMPQHGFGIIIMTNTFNNFMNAVGYQVIDHMLGATDRDWAEPYYESYIRQYESAKELREQFESTRITGTAPTHSLQSYVGRYLNDLYDTARVGLKNDQLTLTIFEDENLSAELEHWHHNTFRINWNNPAQREEFLQFHMNYEGNIDRLEIRFTLRPMMLQIGAYPTNYYRDVVYEKADY